MADVQVVTPARRGGLDRARRVPRTSRTQGRRRPRPAGDVSEARRSWNRGRIGVGSELLCECAHANCSRKLPAVAEMHRGTAKRFIVTPEHLSDGVVVRAADLFFVIELGW